MPSPEQMKALAEKMPGGLPQGGMPSLPKDLPVGLRSGLPNLPGLTGLSGKPTLPGLGGFPGLGKKEMRIRHCEPKRSNPEMRKRDWIASSQVLLANDG